MLPSCLQTTARLLGERFSPLLQEAPGSSTTGRSCCRWGTRQWRKLHQRIFPSSLELRAGCQASQSLLRRMANCMNHGLLKSKMNIMTSHSLRWIFEMSAGRLPYKVWFSLLLARLKPDGQRRTHWTTLLRHRAIPSPVKSSKRISNSLVFLYQFWFVRNVCISSCTKKNKPGYY